MSDPAVPQFVHDDLKKLNINLPDDRLNLLATFLDNLLEANKQFNLTGIRDRDEAWKRHIIDSLTLLPGIEQLEKGDRVVDIGSGGGLPGIPIAIVRPYLSITLVESTGKKCKFLETCAKDLSLGGLSVVNERAETAGQNPMYRETYDVAICRALGPMRQLLEYTLPFVRQGGCVLAMKGSDIEKELSEAGDALMILGAGEMQVIEAYPPDYGVNTSIVWIEKSQPTPKEYPRRPGTPKQDPL